MPHMLDSYTDDDSDMIIGSVVLLLLKHNEEVTPQSILKTIRRAEYSGVNGSRKAEMVILNSIKK